MRDKKNWYAVITADVLYDKTITARQKLLVAIISNLANEKGYCFASNKTLSEFIGVSVATLKRDLSVLEEKYINRVVKLKPNGQVDYRGLTPVSHMRGGGFSHEPITGSPVNGGGCASEPRGGVTNEPYNNKEYNNKLNNKTKNKENSVFEDLRGNDEIVVSSLAYGKKYGISNKQWQDIFTDTSSDLIGRDDEMDLLIIEFDPDTLPF